ncbi:hypothetical protein K469DRAFT_163532 [Zopfia rhizophila CBS 207.26]|uniref:Uncharacterized protein n=1 Tax=Zopfia rhizophila CBS 207.26 TaxID=1314779 RepID=A0A6A6D521_9PEZI|nr:hypothetical protein K469DRAFT_163532 [Zopfia rhizophila CBS 207.26]
MYEAGYLRGKPGCKPELTEWAKAHNPDKHELYDNLRFVFRRAVYSDEPLAKIGA